MFGLSGKATTTATTTAASTTMNTLTRSWTWRNASSPLALWNVTPCRFVGAKSARNKTTKWIGTHKEPLTEEQNQRRLRKHKPFVLGRDNVKRDFTPIAIPDECLAIRDPQQLGFLVKRTENQALPVYTRYRNARSQITTVIRRIHGDPRQLGSLLCKFLPQEKIEVRPELQQVHVKGNVQRTLRYYLTALGF